MDAERPSITLSFRAGCFHALVLRPETPLSDWLEHIDALLARSPGFFAAKSVVIDISGLSLNKQEFLVLLDELSKRAIRILGVEGANLSDFDGRVPFLARAQPDKFQNPAEPASPSKPPSVSSLLIDAPVRSGQFVVCPDGDITIVGSVASGAEVVAAGSIHVYGALRGRVFAGAFGNRRARIFCHRLEAELMAIDGHYIVAEEIDSDFRQAPIQAWLESDVLKITHMD